MRSFMIVCLSAVLLLGGADASARGYGRYYGGHHYGHRHGHGHDYAPYLFGGLLLGTLLAPPRYYYPPPREVIYYERHAYVPPRVVYARPRPSQPPVTTGRRLLRDLNGDCFEREFDSSGNELRTQLPASECAW